MPLPRIAISLGDPFGIGPEVVVAALADPSLRGSAQWVIHGSSQPMLEAAEKRNIEPWWYRVDCDGERQEHGFSHPAVLIDEPLPSSGPSQPGPSDIGGHFSKQWVERAVADTLPQRSCSARRCHGDRTDCQIKLENGGVPVARAHRVAGPSVSSKTTRHGVRGGTTEDRAGHVPPAFGNGLRNPLYWTRA